MQYTHAFIRSFAPELDFLLVLRIVYLVQITRRRCVGVLKTQNISVSLLDGNSLIRRCHLTLSYFYSYQFSIRGVRAGEDACFCTISNECLFCSWAVRMYTYYYCMLRLRSTEITFLITPLSPPRNLSPGTSQQQPTNVILFAVPFCNIKAITEANSYADEIPVIHAVTP